jgi:hypothetical protein
LKGFIAITRGNHFDLVEVNDPQQQQNAMAKPIETY